MTVREILQDIVEHIRKANNSKDGERIPTSDDLVRKLAAEYALEKDTIRYYLRVFYSRSRRDPPRALKLHTVPLAIVER